MTNDNSQMRTTPGNSYDAGRRAEGVQHPKETRSRHRLQHNSLGRMVIV
jgi:hypothetical protein